MVVLRLEPLLDFVDHDLDRIFVVLNMLPIVAIVVEKSWSGHVTTEMERLEARSASEAIAKIQNSRVVKLGIR